MATLLSLEDLIADDLAAFAAQVVHVLRDPTARATLTHNARHLVETRYDWTQIGQQFNDLLESTIQKRTSV